MRKAAKAQGLDVSIHAVSKSQVPEYADKIDVLLLGPHFSAEVPKLSLIHIYYIDRAISAKTDNRPEFQQMIKDSDKKLFDIVLV